MPAPPVRIARPHAAGPGRVETLVDGRPVWFEADPATVDVPLVAAPEAWGSGFLLPALHHRRALEIEGAVDAHWARNAQRLERQLCHDWGYARQPLVFDGTATAATRDGRRHGLFFTAGVDSFHALLCSGEGLDTLINVHGFDVALGDGPRQRAARDAVRAVAATRGLGTLFLRTNLREHPLLRDTPWDAAHGGALAAAGHVSSGMIERIAIGSSQPRWSVNPWGSHWRTDPLWSSAALGFVHLDADVDRLAKIRAIAADPLVQRHLRVCWEQTGTRLNCSRCEKCMLTMLALETVGRRQACKTFEPVDLIALVRARRRSQWRLPMLHEIARSKRLDPELRRAVRAMWWRSVVWRTPALRRLAGAVRRGFRARRTGEV